MRAKEHFPLLQRRSDSPQRTWHRALHDLELLQSKRPPDAAPPTPKVVPNPPLEAKPNSAQRQSPQQKIGFVPSFSPASDSPTSEPPAPVELVSWPVTLSTAQAPPSSSCSSNLPEPATLQIAVLYGSTHPEGQSHPARPSPCSLLPPKPPHTHVLPIHSRGAHAHQSARYNARECQESISHIPSARRSVPTAILRRASFRAISRCAISLRL